MKHPLTVSAQFLEAGRGGICRVARLTILALTELTDIRTLAAADMNSAMIGNVRGIAFRGDRLRFVVANNMDIVRGRSLIYDFAGTARAHLLRIPRNRGRYAVWAHGWEVWGRDGIRQDYARAIRNADLVLANSQYTLERTRDALGPLPDLRLCPLGTEADVAPPRMQASDGPPTLLFVGRNDSQFAKGQDILIDVWPKVVSKVPEARLRFVGGGSHLPHLNSLARKSPAAQNIDVLGFIDDDEIDAVWEGATAMAMLSYVEGFGLVFIEAMRHGIPILASTEDASPEVNIDGVTGLNVSRDDFDGIVDRIVLLLSDRDRAAKFGCAGLGQWRRNYCFSAFAHRLGPIVSEFLDG